MYLQENHQIPQVTIQDLDEQHIFIRDEPSILARIQQEIDKWHEKNTFENAEETKQKRK